MRTGSGAVLLVGFALVVMLLSVAGALTSPAIGMKQDPSQDFADIAASIRQITYACGNFGGNTTDRSRYYNATLGMLSRQLGEKGIMLNYTTIVYWDVCTVVYTLQSNDNSTYIEGVASTDISLENALRNSLHGGGGQGLPLPFIVIPSALCFRDTGTGIYPPGDICFNGICFSSRIGVYYLMLNINPAGINARLSYAGNDSLQDWYITLISLDPTSIPPLNITKAKDNDNDGDIEFYLKPFFQRVTVRIGRSTVTLPKIAGGVGYIKINHTSGQSGLVDELIVTAPGYSPKQIPIYWNECPLTWRQMWKELQMAGKSLRSGG